MVQTEGREGSPNLSSSLCLLVFIQTLKNQQTETSGTIFHGRKSVTGAFVLFTCEILVSGKAAGALPRALEHHHAIMQHVSSTVFNCRDFVSREM